MHTIHTVNEALTPRWHAHVDYLVFSECIEHKIRRETEAKAKVVASVWGAKFIQFLAARAVLPRSIWKKRLNTALSFFRISIPQNQNPKIKGGFDS